MSNVKQAPGAVVMVRPHHFVTNPQTETDNAFQQAPSAPDLVARLAYEQVTKAALLLRVKGIDVLLFEDESTKTPDSVFPNNWFSTHTNGSVCIYAMYPENRRLERRSDIIETLKSQYIVNQVIDYSPYETQDLFLEGTGAMVLDHPNQIAYAVRSHRCSEPVFEQFCQQLNYSPVLFDASDCNGRAVYHTNVLMCVGTEYALISEQMIRDEAQRQNVINTIKDSGKTFVSLTEEQINQFAGNALEVESEQGRFLVLSQTAHNALTSTQIKQLSQYVTLLPIDVSALEHAGGSIRCMLAGIHLPKR